MKNSSLFSASRIQVKLQIWWRNVVKNRKYSEVSSKINVLDKYFQEDFQVVWNFGYAHYLIKL